MYVAVALFIALGAFNSQNNLLFWAFGFALALLIVSGVLSGSMMMALQVRRLPIPLCAAGNTPIVRYSVTNTNRIMPAFGILIGELVPKSQRRTNPLAGGLAFLPYLAPGSTTVLALATPPAQRGVTPLNTIRAWTSFPFGLLTKTIEFDQPAELVVTPAFASLPRTLRAAHQQRDASNASTNAKGDSDEIHSLRQFSTGDNTRQIAWSASARSSQLLVRQNTAPVPERQHVTLVLDPREDDQANERAISVAAAIAQSAVLDGRAVSMRVLPDAPHQRASVRAGTGPRHLATILDSLARVDLHAVSHGTSTSCEPHHQRGSTVAVVPTSRSLRNCPGSSLTVCADDPSIGFPAAPAEEGVPADLSAHQPPAATVPTGPARATA